MPEIYCIRVTVSVHSSDIFFLKFFDIFESICSLFFRFVLRAMSVWRLCFENCYGLCQQNQPAFEISKGFPQYNWKINRIDNTKHYSIDDVNVWFCFYQIIEKTRYNHLSWCDSVLNRFWHAYNFTSWCQITVRPWKVWSIFPRYKITRACLSA